MSVYSGAAENSGSNEYDSSNIIDSDRQHRVKMTVAGGIIEQLQLQLTGFAFSMAFRTAK